MNRLVLIIALALSAGLLFAQERIVSTRVSTDPVGAKFYVDEVEYQSSHTFLWPEGSRHELRVDPQVYGTTKSWFFFKQWMDDTGNLGALGPRVTVTATPNIRNIKALVQLRHAVELNFYDCAAPEASSCPDPPGILWVNESPYTRNTVVWKDHMEEIKLRADPRPGYVFTGWDNSLGGSSAFARQLVVDQPRNVTARFAPGKHVTFQSTPALELRVLVDRQEIQTPTTMYFASNSRHLLGAPAYQIDKLGNHWMFDSFDIGGAQNTEYTTVDTNIPQTITARFVPAAQVSFVTQPVGLKLNVDGRDNWPSHNFVWAVGSTHQVTAPTETTDGKGRKYLFKGWSNGGPSAQDVTVPAEAQNQGLRLIATYEIMPRVTVAASAGIVTVVVDGVECPTPCTIDRPRGSSARVTVPPSVPVSETQRLEFVSWSDGGSTERTIEFDADTRAVTASYRNAWRLTAIADPGGAARFSTQPNSEDHFFADGLPVTISATAGPGFRFRRWEGDLNGSYTAGTLLMSSPRVVRAVFERVPFIPPTGVRNAAAETPDPVVAAGSLVLVSGANLAPFAEAGPINPMAQSLAGVIVRQDNRLMPLIAVGPEQILLQLPWDVAEGDQKLSVRWSGQSEVTGAFTVARNAPGLFTLPIDGRNFAVARHEDGTEVSLESPARRGEVITILGTGFGPLEQRPPDGFAVPAAPAYKLADKAEVIAGDLLMEPLWAGAIPGEVGKMGVHVRIGDELPPASSVELKLRVNGRDSNTVLLPIE